VLLKKHGIEAFHYYKEAIATVSQEGRDIMNRILSAIERLSPHTQLNDPDLIFRDFRNGDPFVQKDPDKFSINPLEQRTNAGLSKRWSLFGKRVLLVPACPLTQKLLADPEIRHADWIGVVDRNPLQQTKTIDGRMIYSYEDIRSLDVNVILVAAPEKHRIDILNAIACNAPRDVQIAEFICAREKAAM
jgi:hypothetical protein